MVADVNFIYGVSGSSRISFGNPSSPDLVLEGKKKSMLFGVDYSLLAKFRYGNRFRVIGAVGPSMLLVNQNPESSENKVSLSPLGFMLNVGLEYDLGPGYLFTTASYAGYYNPKGADAVTPNNRSYKGYNSKIAINMGYALRFKSGNYYNYTKEYHDKALISVNKKEASSPS